MARPALARRSLRPSFTRRVGPPRAVITINSSQWKGPFDNQTIGSEPTGRVVLLNTASLAQLAIIEPNDKSTCSHALLGVAHEGGLTALLCGRRLAVEPALRLVYAAGWSAAPTCHPSSNSACPRPPRARPSPGAFHGPPPPAAAPARRRRQRLISLGPTTSTAPLSRPCTGARPSCQRGPALLPDVCCMPMYAAVRSCPASSSGKALKWKGSALPFRGHLPTMI